MVICPSEEIPLKFGAPIRNEPESGVRNARSIHLSYGGRHRPTHTPPIRRAKRQHLTIPRARPQTIPAGDKGSTIYEFRFTMNANRRSSPGSAFSPGSPLPAPLLPCSPSASPRPASFLSPLAAASSTQAKGRNCRDSRRSAEPMDSERMRCRICLPAKFSARFVAKKTTLVWLVPHCRVAALAEPPPTSLLSGLHLWLGASPWRWRASSRPPDRGHCGPLRPESA